MLRLSPSTTTAIALHAADQSWVMFVQCRPNVGIAPIKIEGVKAKDLIPRTRSLTTDNPFDTHLIGLLPTTNPTEDAQAVQLQFVDEHIRDGWFNPAGDLLSYVDAHATSALMGLLSLVHPAAIDDGAVSIEEIAEMLDCSVVTIRRMVKAGQIPHLRWGRTLRFVPGDVIASLQVR